MKNLEDFKDYSLTDELKKLLKKLICLSLVTVILVFIGKRELASSISNILSVGWVLIFMIDYTTYKIQSRFN